MSEGNGHPWEHGRDLVFHFRCFNWSDLMPRGGLTVAARYAGGELRAQFAYCSPTDNFSGKRGIAIASGRLSKRGVAVELPGYADWDIVRTRCFHAAMTHAKLSHTVRRFFEDHLMCDNLLARRRAGRAARARREKEAVQAAASVTGRSGG